MTGLERFGASTILDDGDLLIGVRSRSRMTDSLAPPSVDVRFGSLTDIGERIRDVRFTPESGHPPGQRQCQLSANSGRE
jgi:hypothetical protein